MEDNNRNFIVAIVLSICVLFAWQYFFALPQQKQQQAEQQKVKSPATAAPEQQAGEKAPPGSLASQQKVSPGPGNTVPQWTREQALAASPRIKIDTPSLAGSIALKGARIDDLTLKAYRETVDPTSPQVILLSPSGTPHAYYAEMGWVAGGDTKALKLPDADTLWTAKTNAPLTQTSPITLTYDNGQGLVFTRIISVDDNYMFTIKESVANSGSAPVTLYHYGLVARHETPKVQGFYILHEGLIGDTEDQGLEEISYKNALKKPPVVSKSKTGWLGITDKYWAATVIPEQGKLFTAKYAGSTVDGKESFQTDFLQAAQTIPPGGSSETTNHVFAGAKVVRVVDGYVQTYGIAKFDLLIDWGWFYFLTKPMFYTIDFLYKLVGNFGLAILIVTVCIKTILFPLAYKSYVSMSKMKKLQPEVQRIKERYADDRTRQQQAMMELYKREKANPASGCLPVLVQVPIFFALYKVLFVTIEMRHAPFFGWIQDLSAPDPTTIFNLFGLIHWTPPPFLMIGVWPLIMGFTMFMQMRLNPTPPDPVQQKVFTWMPVFFTFLLARFPAGLVIYWAWNNTLSVLQQSIIMYRQGVDIPLFENLGFKRKTGKNAKSGAKAISKGESKG